MVDTLITVVLGSIMFSIGLSLRHLAFRDLLRRPRSLLLGLSLQLGVLPLLAILVMLIAGLPSSYSLGFIVLAACPGGLSSNYISFLLDANTPLAVSLTLCNSALAMLTVPFIVNLGIWLFLPGDGAVELALLPTALRIFSIVLLPVVAGMGVRHLYPRFSKAALPHLRRLSLLLLGAVFVVKLFAPADNGGSALTWQEIGLLLPVALLINGIALSFGRVFGSLAGLSRDSQITLGVEVGIQNTSLAFLIATAFLHDEQALKPALVYAMFTFFTAVGYGLLLKPDRWPGLWRELTGR